MAFIKNDTIEVGDRCITTKVFKSCMGTFEKGSIVTVSEVGDRGYGIRDDEGNEIIEIGWSGLKKL